MNAVGIDPGLTGYVCRIYINEIDSSNGIRVGFYPLSYNKTRTCMTASLFGVFDDASYVAIEQLGYMGISKGNSLFTMAQCFGALTQCVEQSYAGEIRYVRPCDWKRVAGLSGKAKSESVAIFQSLVPEFGKVKHDQAEAFLLAVGYKKGESTDDVRKRLLDSYGRTKYN